MWDKGFGSNDFLNARQLAHGVFSINTGSVLLHYHHLAKVPGKKDHIHFEQVSALKSLWGPAGAMDIPGCYEIPNPSWARASSRSVRLACWQGTNASTPQTFTNLHQKLHCEVRSPIQKKQTELRGVRPGKDVRASWRWPCSRACWVGLVSQVSLPMLSHSPNVYRSPTRC